MADLRFRISNLRSQSLELTGRSLKLAPGEKRALEPVVRQARDCLDVMGLREHIKTDDIVKRATPRYRHVIEAISINVGVTFSGQSVEQDELMFKF